MRKRQCKKSRFNLSYSSCAILAPMFSTQQKKQKTFLNVRLYRIFIAAEKYRHLFTIFLNAYTK